MVRLQVKRGTEDQFLFEANVDVRVQNLIQDIVAIFNGRLKIKRICLEIEDLAKHGIMLPPEILGLTKEQVEELKLTDPWADKCVPSGGFTINNDPTGRRNGRQPKTNMQDVLSKAVEEARRMIDKKLVKEDIPLTLKIVEEAMNILKGSVTIVYPMQLPPHDTIRMEFTNTENLDGTYASNEVIEPSKAQLWFAGHQMFPEKKLLDYIGRNNKSKIIVKLSAIGEGAPAREPVISEQLRNQLMAAEYRRQEELKKLEQDDDDQYLNSSWADSSSLKRQVHGMGDIKFRFGN